MSERAAQEWCKRLLALGVAVRDRITAARRGGEDLASAVAQTGGDTIFAIDRHVEPVIEHLIDGWSDRLKPLILIAEGMGDNGRRRFGSAEALPKFRLIIDPIDGTRNLMYDKRAAWFLAAAAPAFRADGTETTLSDAFASVMVELPTSKQGIAYSFSATRGGAAQGFWQDLAATKLNPLPKPQPSAAETLKHGFAQVSNFFPGTKVLASGLMEKIVSETLGPDVEPGTASVFDDQYMTTGGQMVELMLGHDRFCCDLRPLFYRLLEKQHGRNFHGRGLECHPYDIAGLLVAQRAGVIVTDGFGRELDAPMDVHEGVHWCGYANEALRKQIEPVIVGWLKERGVTKDDNR